MIWLRVLVASIALALVACSSTLSVVEQADPNPLVAAPRFVVLPLDFSSVDIVGKTEAEYLAKQEPESREAFPSDKEGMAKAFAVALEMEAGTKGLTITPGAANGKDFVIAPKVEFLEPGYWGGAAKAVTKIRLEIRTADGKKVDEIVVKGVSFKTQTGMGALEAVQASKTGDRGSRMNKAAADAAMVLVEYLAERTRG